MYENFYQQYQNNLFGNIAKENKNTLIFGKEFYLNKIFLYNENDAVTETENLKNQFISEGTDEISALKLLWKLKSSTLMIFIW